jgi:hypothetical protein
MLTTPAHAIVNGSRDGDAHSYVGALTVEYGGARALACTGVLVSPTVVVTAAHCTAMLEQLGYEQADVTFSSDIGDGTDFPCALVDCVVEPDASTLHTGTIHTNPAFNGNTTGVDSHDVGVVTFDEPITGITPAKLPAAAQLDAMAAHGNLSRTSFTDVGYGWHSVLNGTDEGMFDGVRRAATASERSLTTSDIWLSNNAALGLGGGCDHDSGSPTMLGGDVAVAVLSGVDGQCHTYYAYRLDTPSARSFLANFVTVP